MKARKSIKRSFLFLSVFTAMVMVISTSAWAGLSGAIFTTDVDGDHVNENLYSFKTDVYLNGGPGPNAPLHAAALPAGWYYFQVTDPSGKVLLSTDPVVCRSFHVNSAGFIDSVSFGGTCTHATGTDTADVSQGGTGAITVQLFPFDTTPNPGGVYKVWATPSDKFVGDPALVDNPQFFHGFVPAWSKTDNFKVSCPCPCTDTSQITIRAIYDSNKNGALDAGDKEIGTELLTNKGGRAVSVTDPLGVVNGDYTPAQLSPLTPGNYLVSDSGNGAWKVVAVYLDGKAVSGATTSVVVPLTGSCGETHEVVLLVH